MRHMRHMRDMRHMRHENPILYYSGANDYVYPTRPRPTCRLSAYERASDKHARLPTRLINPGFHRGFWCVQTPKSEVSRPFTIKQNWHIDKQCKQYSIRFGRCRAFYSVQIFSWNVWKRRTSVDETGTSSRKSPRGSQYSCLTHDSIEMGPI